MQLSVAERATQAHGILRQSGTVPTNLLAAEIYESWLRCVALRLEFDKAAGDRHGEPQDPTIRAGATCAASRSGARGNANVA